MPIKRGRPPLKKKEKRKILQVFIKAKNYAKAKKRIGEIVREYNSN